MRRSGLIAAFAVLLSLPAWPQMRGAHVVGVRPAGAVRVPAVPSRANGKVSAVVGHGFIHGGFGHPGAFPFHHHHFNGRFGFLYPWFYAYYPGWYSDYPMDYSDYDRSYNQDQQLQAYQQQQINNQQQIELRLDALEERLDRLYEEKLAPPQTQTQPERQPKNDASLPAVLVYKDGHRQEVQNYAIVGQTIWVLNEQQARKVPLSALDLNATRKANEDRDVEFALPTSTT